MTDYAVGTGSAGSLIIRDTGSVVQFIIACSDPATNTGGLGWSGFINGVSVGGSVSLSAGFGSRVVAAYVVSTSQSVSFSIAASGTMGLGGPATVSAYLSRATVPPAPVPLGLDQITPTSMRYQFSSTGDGGSPITTWQFRYATSEALLPVDAVYQNSTGTSTVTGLTPGVRYFFQARGWNAVGPGPWSAVISAETLAGGRAWDGSAWRNCRVKTWNGTAWQTCRVRQWDGSTWRSTR